MSISKRKLAANRANAQKSTGPVTEAGKERSSHNRLAHGLCGEFRVRAYEDQDRYNNLLERFIATEQPIDDVEHELVVKMARHTWQSDRASRMQESAIASQPLTKEQEKAGLAPVAVTVEALELYLRYQAAHDRAYQRAANELAKRRKDRMLAARGFESQKRAEAEEKRREERQDERRELRPYKVATAKLHLEHQQERTCKAKAAGQAPDFGQMQPDTGQIAA